eukprot:jgi/Picsp_1/2896/NSC_01121-R1_protein
MMGTCVTGSMQSSGSHRSNIRQCINKSKTWEMSSWLGKSKVVREYEAVRSKGTQVGTRGAMRLAIVSAMDGRRREVKEFTEKNIAVERQGEGGAVERQRVGPALTRRSSIDGKSLGLLVGLGAITGGGGLLGSGFDVSGPGSVLEALGVLAAVVGVHELGHFSAARLQNIHVKKFAIGFGPVLWKYSGREVEYSLRAIPLGGFVAFPDEDEDSPYEKDDPDLLTNRPVLDRVIVTCAGVAANIVFALGICTFQAAVVGITEPEYSPGILMGTINPDTVAEKAGLKRGDIVLQLGDLKLAPEPGMVGKFVNTVKVNPKKPLDVKVKRGEEILDLTVTPAEMPDGSGRIGVALAPNVKLNKVKADGPVEAIALGFKEFLALGRTVSNGLYQFVTNFQESSKNVSGPVAILAVGSEVARTDINGLYQFAALININLAIVNILPLPALDGGYLVFQLLEAIRGKKVDPDFEKGIMASGFLLLTSVGIFLIIKDALNLSSNIR